MVDRQTPLNANDPPEQTKPDQVNQRQQEQQPQAVVTARQDRRPVAGAKAALSQLTIKRPEWTAIECDIFGPQAGRKVKTKARRSAMSRLSVLSDPSE